MATSLSPTTWSPELTALRAAYAAKVQGTEVEPPSETSPQPLFKRLKGAVERFDGVVARHPKTAVTVAAVAGGVIGVVQSRRTRTSSGIIRTAVGTLGGTVMAGLGIEALLVEFPQGLQSLATTLAATPGHVEAAVVGVALAAGAAIGRALARRGRDQKTTPESPSMPERLPGLIASTLLPHSGTLLGGAIGLGVAALLGPLAAVPATLAAAGGAFAGTALGPVIVPGGLSNRWWKAFIYSQIPVGALIGYTLGHDVGSAVQGAAIGGVGTAAGTKGMAHDIIFR